MLKDCMEIFEEELARAEKRTGNPDSLILDNYVLDEGDYLVVRKNGKVVHCSVKKDKKTKTTVMSPQNSELYDEICFYDYHSRLISMQKPIDPRKQIHSNNYLSFWVKWDSLIKKPGKKQKKQELNMQLVNNYFDILADPKSKYKHADLEMYEYIEEKLGQPDKKKLEECRTWICENIFNMKELELKYTEKFAEKNYLKIFFEADREDYIREDKRYLMTKIFNNNQYNLEVNGILLGLPNNNVNLNPGKPFLQHQTRKIGLPCMIAPEEAVMQKLFFDYLMMKANADQTEIFFDCDDRRIICKKRGEMINGDFSGYFLRIKKGKQELVIQHQDMIVDYKPVLSKPFHYQNVLDMPDEEDLYKEYGHRQALQSIINEILFFNYLSRNYFTETKDLPVNGELKRTLIWSRESIFTWLYKGREEGVERILHTACMNIILYSVVNGYMWKASQQFNLMYSIEAYFGGNNMINKYNRIKDELRIKINQPGDCAIESDEEYCFAVGQLAYYFVSLNKSNEKNHALANPFLKATRNETLQKLLRQYFVKYNYRISIYDTRFNRMYSLVMNYQLENGVSQEDLIAGYLSSNLLYAKGQDVREKTKEKNGETETDV